MRVNNPKLMMNFNESNNKSSQNLITTSQLITTVNNLRSYFIDILHGPNKNVDASYGYAWLASNGKLDPSLLPKLAITDTYTVDYNTLIELANLNAIILDDLYINKENLINNFKIVLNIWLKSKIQNENKSFQEGDIIVITTTESEEPIQDLIGSYIITNTPDNPISTGFEISKLTHNDGLVTSINNKYPSNIGSVTLNLYDILKINYEKSFTLNDAADKANDLSDTVYRLIKVNEGNDNYRFGFIGNNSLNDIVLYTKLDEFNEEKEITSSRFSIVNTELNLKTNIDEYLSSTLIGFTPNTTVSSELNRNVQNLNSADIYISGELNRNIQDLSAVDIFINGKLDDETQKLKNLNSYISGKLDNQVLILQNADNLLSSKFDQKLTALNEELNDQVNSVYTIINRKERALNDFDYLLSGKLEEKIHLLQDADEIISSELNRNILVLDNKLSSQIHLVYDAIDRKERALIATDTFISGELDRQIHLVYHTIDEKERESIAADTFISGKLGENTIKLINADNYLSGQVDIVSSKLITVSQGNGITITENNSDRIIAAKVNVNDSVLNVDEDGLFTSIQLVKLGTPSAGFAASYKLVGKDGLTELGDIINIPKDQFLSGASFDTETSSLILTFAIKSENDTEVGTPVSIPAADFFKAYLAGSGLTLVNGTFNIEKDLHEDSKFLKINDNSIGLDGISEAIETSWTSNADKYTYTNGPGIDVSEVAIGKVISIKTESDYLIFDGQGNLAVTGITEEINNAVNDIVTGRIEPINEKLNKTITINDDFNKNAIPLIDVSNNTFISTSAIVGNSNISLKLYEYEYQYIYANGTEWPDDPEEEPIGRRRVPMDEIPFYLADWDNENENLEKKIKILATEEAVVNYVKEYVPDYLSGNNYITDDDSFWDAGVPIYDPTTKQISQSHAWIGNDTLSLNSDGTIDYSMNGTLNNSYISKILATENAVIDYVKTYETTPRKTVDSYLSGQIANKPNTSTVTNGDQFLSAAIINIDDYLSGKIDTNKTTSESTDAYLSTQIEEIQTAVNNGDQFLSAAIINGDGYLSAQIGTIQTTSQNYISIKYGENGEEWAETVYDETNNKGIIITYNPYDHTVQDTMYTIGESNFSIGYSDNNESILDAEFLPNGAACTDILATEEGTINYVKEYVSAYISREIEPIESALENCVNDSIHYNVLSSNIISPSFNSYIEYYTFDSNIVDTDSYILSACIDVPPSGKAESHEIWIEFPYEISNLSFDSSYQVIEKLPSQWSYQDLSGNPLIHVFTLRLWKNRNNGNNIYLLNYSHSFSDKNN